MRAGSASVLLAVAIVLLTLAGAFAMVGRTVEALLATASAAGLGLLGWRLSRPGSRGRALGIGLAAG